jgi:hypothetical protein
LLQRFSTIQNIIEHPDHFDEVLDRLFALNEEQAKAEQASMPAGKTKAKRAKTVKNTSTDGDKPKRAPRTKKTEEPGG